MSNRFQKTALIALFAATSSASMSAPTTNVPGALVLEKAPVVKDVPAARPIAPSIIRYIERSVRLPPSAEPFAKYERYYTWVTVGGRSAISAEFILPIGMVDHVPAAHVVNSEKKFPYMTDMGCEMITFRYDIESKRVSDLSCAGR